jgi:hypothetical protein
VAQVISAAMRPGTTLMDVTYQITDPDDATVKVRALAFKDGTRSFANVIRPVTWMEGSQTNIGDTITTGVNHTLTWDVRADWNIDLANVQFEVLCQDKRGLLPLNWITIPATTNTAAVTVSTDVPADAQVLDALFWLYADGDANLGLTNGNLTGTAASGIFCGEVLVYGTTLALQATAHTPGYFTPEATIQPDVPIVFLYKRMNLARATFKEKDLAISARAGLADRYSLYAANRPWNEEMVGIDLTAVTTNVINGRWVQHIYANGAITMSDRFTGLMWLGSSASMNWDAAMTYCANLSYAGYDDWSLPSLSQLSRMSSHYQLFNLSSSCWSTKSGEPDSRFAWLVRLSTKTYGYYYKSNSYGAWPVRAGE